MNDSITIEMSLPAAELCGNKPVHHMKLAGIKKAQRETAWKLGLAAKGSWVTPKHAAIYLHFRWPDMIRRDLFNYASGCKAAIDGLVDAGLMVDDNWQVMSVGGVTAQIDRDNPGVTITIERNA
tara:strand:- start:3803 stop:4174 length:372 start_codon:yes stop_codon:yes gene_type:complete